MVPVLKKDGSYSRTKNNPQIKDASDKPIYTPHHQDMKKMQMLDYKVHRKFPHVGGVSNANR
ncbi:HNH endonuclease [Pseudoalteromonas sp. TB64]|uniref:HNH endonuclease n=1 Tax=Pseudoalteromonas sp. TB64 TaxID=1938600 RepID=UPI000467E285|nr:HNH endonuclease [Pseudoalteromonas sp. TB64]